MNAEQQKVYSRKVAVTSGWSLGLAAGVIALLLGPKGFDWIDVAAALALLVSAVGLYRS